MPSFIHSRMEERGVHGVFLQAIKAMFHVVRQKVRVNGNLGEEFDTFLSSVRSRGSRSADRIQQDPRSHVCRRVYCVKLVGVFN